VVPGEGLEPTSSYERRILSPFPKLKGLTGLTTKEYYKQFMESRTAGNTTQGTLRYYRAKLSKFLENVNPDTANPSDIDRFLMQFNNAGNRHAYFRAIRAFYGWREDVFGLANPVKRMKSPKVPKLILPSLKSEDVNKLIEQTESARNKAIISLFVESGLRLSELANIKLTDIDWQSKTIRVLGKGRKEALAPFGELSKQCLTQWLNQYNPDGNIWGIKERGIASMLKRLEKATGQHCNAHTFRRTFACLLRKAGIDTMTIKDLGRWESLEMVQRYTRSVNFQDSLKFYKAPLS